MGAPGFQGPFLLAVAGQGLGFKGWLGVLLYILLFLAAAWGIWKIAGPDGGEEDPDSRD